MYIYRALACVTFAVSVVMSAGCASTTLFKDNFNSNPLQAPPAVAQSVGTAGVFGGGAVIAQLTSASGHWLQITKQDPNSIAGMGANLSTMPGYGFYGFLGLLYIPKLTGSTTAATVAFNTQQPLPEGGGLLQQLMHLDFLPNNVVRIDDNPATDFGRFPNDAAFTVSVKLDIYPQCAVAHITLLGGKASGSADYHLVPPPGNMLSQPFAVMQFYMGTPWTGSFDASNLLVTYQPLKSLSTVEIPQECSAGTKGSL
jgi:hypothetical protein